MKLLQSLKLKIKRNLFGYTRLIDFRFHIQKSYSTLSLRSWVKYIIWVINHFKGDKIFRLKSGYKIEVRPNDKSGELWVFEELFLTQDYQIPKVLSKEKVKLIVDLGGNVGYSVVHFAAEFPNAHIIVWEPYESHYQQLRKHIEINKLENRVESIKAAAGVNNQRDILNLEGIASYIGEKQQSHHLNRKDDHQTNEIEIETKDLFEYLHDKQIDFLIY